MKLGLTHGDPLPQLELGPLVSADNEQPGLQTLRPDRPYVINFWATYCGPCVKEMPELQRLSSKLSEAGFQLIGVSLDDQDFGRVKKFGEQLGVTYPLFRTNPATIQRVFPSGEMFIPLSLVVDANGRVVDVMAGWNAETERKIRKLIEP